MNEYLLSVLLGIVEGITEFLPVSSTAHLRISEYFLGVSLENEFWKLFSILIQLGAILSVVHIYRSKLLSFLSEGLADLFSLRWLNKPFGFLGFAFVTTAIPALLLRKLIGKNLESLTVMCLALFIGGIIMVAVDFLCKKPSVDRIEDMKPWRAIWIGFCQIASAIFPGTSRSMSTIAAGQISGMSRQSALDFSFIVSIPVMCAATVYDLFRYMKAHMDAGHGIGLDSHQVALLLIGFVVSFVVAYAVVAWFLGFVKKHGFLIFGIYRVVLAGYLFFFVKM